MHFDTSFWRSLLSFPFYPIPFLCLILLAYFVCKWKKWFRCSKWLTYLGIVYFLVVSTSPLPDYLLGDLEAQYPPLIQIPILPSTPKILVLGAGHNDNPSLQLTNQLTQSELYRLIEGIRIQKLLPGSILVTSGAKCRTNHEAQAVVVKKVAVLLGVEEDTVDTLSSTTNTMDEALFFKQRFGTENPIILVTDAVHMPRAMNWFHKFGMNPIPAPTNHWIKDEPQNRRINLIPNSNAITKMEIVIHEYLGQFWLEILDWSGKLNQYKQIN